MTYTENADTITLEMTKAQYDQLLMMLGFAAGAAHKDVNETLFYHFIAFTNKLNATNPHFNQYALPEEFAG